MSLRSFCFLLGLGFLGACGSRVQPEKQAQRLCDCAQPLLQDQAQTSTQIEAQIQTCLGKDNPLEQLHSGQDSLEFKRGFVQALQTLCPETAAKLRFY